MKGVTFYEVRNWSAGQPGALSPVTVTADKVFADRTTPQYGQVSATTCFASDDTAQAAGYTADSGVLTNSGAGAESPQQRRCFFEADDLLTAYANQIVTAGFGGGDSVTAVLTQYPFLPASAQVYRSYVSSFALAPNAVMPYTSEELGASSLTIGSGGQPDPNVKAAMTSVSDSCAAALAGRPVQGPSSIGSDSPSTSAPESPTPTPTSSGAGQSTSYQDGYTYGNNVGTFQKPIPDAQARCAQGYATQTNDDRAEWMRGCQDGILSAAGA